LDVKQKLINYILVNLLYSIDLCVIIKDKIKYRIGVLALAG